MAAPFFPEVKVTFNVRDAAEHYHVPLLSQPVRILHLPRDIADACAWWNRYGKSRIRLVKVRRRPRAAPMPRTSFVDLTIDVQLEGAFEPVYVDGDNAPCLATDTMKNTVYALARQTADRPRRGIRVDARRTFPRQAGRVPRASYQRSRAPVGAAVGRRPHASSRVRAARRRAVDAVVTRDRRVPASSSGLTNLVVLKTTDSAFAGFPRDAYTTLPETDDRILATAVTAVWTYRDGTADFSARERIRAALIETFAAHDSRSVQHTLYAMAEAALAACADDRRDHADDAEPASSARRSRSRSASTTRTRVFVADRSAVRVDRRRRSGARRCHGRSVDDIHRRAVSEPVSACRRRRRPSRSRTSCARSRPAGAASSPRQSGCIRW